MTITRSKFIHERIRNFLNSSDKCFYENLYKDEIKKFQRQFPGIKITKEYLTHADKYDRRFTCLIERTDA